MFGSQANYAQAMINDYKAANVPPSNVWAQSFNKADVLTWIQNTPEFGHQAVYLDDANVVADLPSADELKTYRKQGIRIVAPPMWALLTVSNGRIVPSQYARNAKAAGSTSSRGHSSDRAGLSKRCCRQKERRARPSTIRRLSMRFAMTATSW